MFRYPQRRRNGGMSRRRAGPLSEWAGGGRGGQWLHVLARSASRPFMRRAGPPQRARRMPDAKVPRRAAVDVEHRLGAGMSKCSAAALPAEVSLWGSGV